MWFDELIICDPQGHRILIDSFIEAGKRWWDAFHAGDERTRGYGMSPLSESQHAALVALLNRFQWLNDLMDDPVLADLVARGREDYGALAPSEQVAFGNYLKEFCVALERFLPAATEGGDELVSLALDGLRIQLSFRGAQEWWREFQESGEAPSVLTDLVAPFSRVLDSVPPESGMGRLGNHTGGGAQDV